MKSVTEESLKYLENKQHTLNNPCIKNEVWREIKTYTKVNQKENTVYQRMWDVALAVLRGKPVALNVHVRTHKKI